MKRVVVAVLLLTSLVAAQSDQPLVFPVLRTSPLASYEDAPATPDADDPAIWVNRDDYRRSLVIGTAKDAGLLVFDLSGRLVQALFPLNTPQVLDIDPPTPAVSTRPPTIHVPRAGAARRLADTTTSTLPTA